MDKGIAILTNRQVLVLRTIGEQADQSGKCDISRIKSAALQELEGEAYITIDARQKTARITALGKMALENHVVTGSPEFFRLQLDSAAPDTGLSVEIPAPSNPSGKPYAGVMGRPKAAAPEMSIDGKPLSEVMTELFPPKQKPAPEAPETPTCAKAGCSEPRTVSKSGRQLQLCEAHQREHMTGQAAKARAGKAKKAKIATVSSEAPRPNGRPSKQAPVELSAVEQPEIGVIEAVIEQVVAAEICEPGCTCIHREVLDMLRAKYPKVDDLVQAMETVRDLKNSLGLEG